MKFLTKAVWLIVPDMPFSILVRGQAGTVRADTSLV